MLLSEIPDLYDSSLPVDAREPRARGAVFRNPLRISQKLHIVASTIFGIPYGPFFLRHTKCLSANLTYCCATGMRS